MVCSVRPDAVQHRQVVGRLRKPLDPARTAAELHRLFSADRIATPSTPDDQAEAATLRQRGLQELEVRARLVGDAGAAVLCGDLTGDLRERARVAAHRSIGLAGPLGEADLAEPARRAEQLLLGEHDLEVADAVALCEVAARLEDEARSRVDSAPEREARAAARGVDGGLVAVVDDDEILVALIRRRLERAGFLVLTYDHGGTALRELRNRPAAPDVLLLDIDLPGLNGLSVLDGLAAAGALGQTRVVLATVHDNEAELARARAAVPGVDHLPKPYDLDRLVDIVLAHSRRTP